jgi:hypothetical protein
VQFTARRIFSLRRRLDTFSALRFVSFSVVNDAGAFHAETDPGEYESARFSCGLFEFTKRVLRKGSREMRGEGRRRISASRPQEA